MDSMFSTSYFCPCYDFDFIHISLFQYTIFAKPKYMYPKILKLW